MRLQNYIDEAKKGDTKASTITHEISTAIFVGNRNAKLVTGKDILKYFAKGSVVAAHMKNKVISPMPDSEWESTPAYKFLIDDPILSKPHVSDAKMLAASMIKSSNIGPATGKTVWWTGPTNDNSKYGSADITYITDKGVQPVSLKYKKGQLKNLGLKSIQNILLKGIIDTSKGDSFAKKLYNDPQNTKHWNELTSQFIAMAIETLKSKGKKELADIVLSYSTNSYDTYMTTKVTKEEAELFRTGSTDPKNPWYKQKDRLLLKKILKRVYSSHNFSGWTGIKKRQFDLLFSTFFNNKNGQLNDNLVAMFKRQMSSGSLDMWYAADSGKEILFIPNEESFDRSGKGLVFDISSKSNPDAYTLTLSAKTKSGKSLVIIDINIRFANGQMASAVTSKSKLVTIIDKDWNNLFKP